VDRVEVPKPLRKEKNLPTTYGTRSGNIDFDFKIATSPASQAEERQVLERLLANSASHLNPGVFGVRLSGGVFHIIPVTMSDASGQPQRYSSPLDTVISIPRVGMSGFDAVRLIADTITAKSGRKILIGTGPFTILGRSNISLVAEQETGRAVLLRTLQGIPYPITWHIYCQPGLDACYLNFFLLPRRAAA